MKPQAGGEYVYVRDAYGPLAGFLYAWTWFVVAKPGTIATVTTGLVRILGTFPVFSFFPAKAITVPFAITWGQIVAIAAAILISFLNYLGVKKAGEFQLVFTLLKIVIILGIVVICFAGAGSVAGHGWSNFAGEFSGAKGGIAGFMAALVAALWAYDGWNDLNMVAGEVKHPERSIPIALIAGVATVAALYMLVNAGVQYVLPANAIAASPRAASDAVALVMGRMGAGVVSAGMAISMLVTLNGSIMSGARIPYAVARDGYFFRVLADVSPRFHTPSVALLVQAVLSIVLLLVGASFGRLFSLTIFAEWLFYMIAASTIFVFRKREPQAQRPYRMWGYPVLPAIFTAVAAALLCYTFKNTWPDSGYGLLVIAAGIPVFAYFAHRRRQKAAIASTS
jgi:APA family basic amino acid/polyamine antiporter